MKKERGDWFIWGIIFVIILSATSLLTYSIPCEGNFPFLNLCFSKIIFIILNIFGVLIVNLFHGGVVYRTELNNLYLLSVLISLPVYFIIGTIIKWILKK